MVFQILIKELITMKKKLGLKIVLATLSALILAALVVLFFYLPRYLTKDVTVTPGENAGEELTIMSANVRYCNPFDFFERSWFYRAELLMSDIANVAPDIVCFQEVNTIHYSYLTDVMQGYESLVTYRDNSLMKEGCSIFYRADRFEEIERGHFWLSETPDVMSKDWGSAHYRICVYVCLKDLTTGEEFIVFNTHLDHKSEEARIKGIEVVLDKIAELDGRPAFLMGDMNALEDTKTIESTKESFDDAKEIALVSTGTTYTYNNWGEPEEDDRIDYILIGKGDATVTEYHVVNNSPNGIYSSDHCPIYIKTKIN